VGASAGEAKTIRRFVQDYALRDAGAMPRPRIRCSDTASGDEAGTLSSPDARCHSGELFAIFPCK
jgi:hypothetical protein